jgi:mannosyltransferase
MRAEIATPVPRIGLAERARRVDLPICALTALVLGLGFFRLGTKSIWLDEATSVDRATTQGIGAMLTGRGDNMGLHSFLLHFWIRAFGEGETAIRSLSVLPAALCVPAVYLVARRLFDRRTGLVAAVLLASNAFLAQWAQVARAYSLLVLLVTLSCYFFLGELEHPSWTNRVAYVVSSAAALDAHYFAAFVVLAQLLTLLALRRRAAFTKSWLGVAGAIVVLGLPETIHALNTGAGQISWIPSPSAGSLKQTMIDLGGGGRIAPTVLLAGCAFAVARAVSRRDRWREGFLVAWLAVPIVISFAASFVQPMFLSRYLIVSVPAFVLLAARGLTKLPAPVLVAGIAAAVCASGFQLATWYSARPREDWRAATRYVLTSTRPGDAVLFYPSYSQEPFAYYERLDGGARARILDPLAPKPNGGPRVWLVTREEDTARVGASLTTVKKALAGYRRLSQRGFSGVQVALYVRAA